MIDKSQEQIFRGFVSAMSENESLNATIFISMQKENEDEN